MKSRSSTFNFLSFFLPLLFFIFAFDDSACLPILSTTKQNTHVLPTSPTPLAADTTSMSITIGTVECPTSAHGLSPQQQNDCNVTKLEGVKLRCQGADWRESLTQMESLTAIYPQIKSISFVDGHFEHDRLDGSTFSTMKLDFRVTHFLDLQRNGLKTIDADAFKAFEQLSTLKLDDNHLTTLPLAALTPLRYSLETLTLRNASANLGTLASWFVTSSSSDALTLVKLRELDLAENQIRAVDPTFFSNLVDLDVFRRLKLDGNRLTGPAFHKFIRGCTDKLVTRKIEPLIVEARRNDIAIVSNQTVEVLEFRNETHLERFQLFMEGNPFACNCSIDLFAKLLKTAHGRTIIMDWNRLTCSPDTPHRRNHVGEAKLCRDGKRAQDWETVKTVLLAFFIIVLGLVTLTVGYLHRKKIIVRWRSVTQCARPSDSPTHKNEEEEDYWWQSRNQLYRTSRHKYEDAL